MDKEEELGEVWSNLDADTREKVIALVLEIAYRFVVNRQGSNGANADTNNSEAKEK